MWIRFRFRMMNQRRARKGLRLPDKKKKKNRNGFDLKQQQQSSKRASHCKVDSVGSLI